MAQPRRLHVVRPMRGENKQQMKTPLFILCIMFIIGVLLGSVFSVLGGSHPQLAAELKDSFQASAQGTLPALSVWSLVWEAACWPLLLVVLSFGAPGVVGIPCVFLVRGFLLSYASTCFVAMYGASGLGWNAVFFGSSALILLPVMICVGHWAFSHAREICVSRERPPLKPPSWSMVICCGVMLAVFFVLQGYLLPGWLPALCKRLLLITP